MMDRLDPTSPDSTLVMAPEREYSLEEVVRMQAADVGDGSADPATRRAVSGRYRGASGGFQIELRVDVDGKRLMRVSGDFYRVSGQTVSYFARSRGGPRLPATRGAGRAISR